MFELNQYKKELDELSNNFNFESLERFIEISKKYNTAIFLHLYVRKLLSDIEKKYKVEYDLERINIFLEHRLSVKIHIINEYYMYIKFSVFNPFDSLYIDGYVVDKNIKDAFIKCLIFEDEFENSKICKFEKNNIKYSVENTTKIADALNVKMDKTIEKISKLK
jgi:hypothetical protein